MYAKSNIVDYTTYCFLYTLTIICNKYVLTSLGFQYPTIFQTWQALVAVIMIQFVFGKITVIFSIIKSLLIYQQIIFVLYNKTCEIVCDLNFITCVFIDMLHYISALAIHYIAYSGFGSLRTSRGPCGL